jgi:hypothetical protein
MPRKAMAMFKCLVAPVAGNNHDNKKKYDICGDHMIHVAREEDSTQ